MGITIIILAVILAMVALWHVAIAQWRAMGYLSDRLKEQRIINFRLRRDITLIRKRIAHNSEVVGHLRREASGKLHPEVFSFRSQEDTGTQNKEPE